jgi:hypothetical protein
MTAEANTLAELARWPADRIQAEVARIARAAC